MRIALVGAFDRYNYGDILMPIVMKQQIKQNSSDYQNLEFNYFSLSKSSMGYTGGFDTEEFSSLYKNYYDIIIYVGGEILTSRYTGMYLNVQTSKIKIYTYKIFRRLFTTFIEDRCRKLLGGKSLKPWVVNKGLLKCKALIYNTVGGDMYFGTTKLNKVEVENNIKKIDYISVREEATFKVVKAINKNATLCPDSVIAVSDLIDDSYIERNVNKRIKFVVNNESNYFVFQINRLEGKKYIKEIVKQIKLINKTTSLRVILLPIGYAQGHEDDRVLKQIYDKLNMDGAFIPNFNNIYETIYIIKNSKFYVGTSLHGAITAISYNIPHIALTSNIKKLKDFLTTWKTTPIIYTEICELSNSVNRLLENYNDAKTQVKDANKKMKELVNNNFNNINQFIKLQ